MLALTFALIVFGARAPAQSVVPSPAQSIAPSPVQSTAPLREVVYDFSVDQAQDRTFDDVGAPGLQSGHATGGYHGSITIDVISASADGSLTLRVIENSSAINRAAPESAEVSLEPDGNMDLVAGHIDDPMAKITPYFAASYFGDHVLQQGATWTGDSYVQRFHVLTTTTVSRVDGDRATIDTRLKDQGSGPQATISGDSRLVYDAPLLVPISLDIRLTVRSEQINGTTDVTIHYGFNRISDTRQPKSG